MDKFRENAFTYSVVGLALLLAAVFFFLVWKPLSGLAEYQRTLDSTARTLKNLKKEDPLPREEYVQYLRKQGELDRAAFRDAESIYGERTRSFGRFFDGTEQVPEPDDFYAKYIDGIRKRQEEYRTRFQIVTPADARQETEIPPVVELAKQEDLNRLGESKENITRAMKQFWIVDAIFSACLKLEIGGLKEIRFPIRRRDARRRRGEEDESDVVDFDHVVGEVTVELPLGKLDDLLKELYDSARVPFVEPEEMVVSKDSQQFEQHRKLEVVKKGLPSRSEAEALAYKALAPDPPLTAKLTLRALDYRGLKEKTSEVEPE